ncbi:LysE family translocator [Tsukamurella ocularis]|uniref:LysE family translocator n=1 Tax=Tsukamurella ocularis TaxID=1970234 RepID=UPI00216A4E93|nr:LysE family transporter [Tsukamurella ocularis]MCS3779151.1 threonine/homoserine/homoserine lactone efflux protein [Tsukamurella ocularis]MCS3787229.1 threonine/homoserine/homoserine lactone efflux protein [Tsukamurella ocularis]MCS3852620.1 threonine/homoserine/homoserine lactone efflux protein [Tsukamurella ocularis]
MGSSALAAAFGAGILAGLGAVLPLGAIGVMLLHEGASRGWRRAVPAAAGVGTADLIFAVLALAAGSVLAPLVAQWGRWPAAVGGLLLIVVAVLMVRKAFRPDPADPNGAELAGGSGGWARYAMFFGLTAVNPFPLVYFGAIAVGLGEGLHRPPVATAFTIGVGIASFGWNLVLIGLGAVLRARSTVRMRRIVTAAGGAIVAVCAVVILVTAFV